MNNDRGLGAPDLVGDIPVIQETGNKKQEA